MKVILAGPPQSGKSCLREGLKTMLMAFLTIFQQAVFMLTKWAGVTLPEDCQYPADDEAIKKAKKIFLGDDHSSLWKQNVTFNPLRLLFDTLG